MAIYKEFFQLQIGLLIPGWNFHHLDSLQSVAFGATSCSALEHCVPSFELNKCLFHVISLLFSLRFHHTIVGDAEHGANEKQLIVKADVLKECHAVFSDIVFNFALLPHIFKFTW